MRIAYLVVSLGFLALAASGCRPYGSLCGDAVCEGTETAATCPGDCGPPVCGDGRCSRETCSTCAVDCGACPACGDGVCNGSETCSTCVSDCGTCPRCGDGSCSASESCSTCPGDCGACRCGNGICESSESCSSCPGDCGGCVTCGDGRCDGAESCSTCSRDCGSCGPSSEPYETCVMSADCINARDVCVFVSNRGVTRGMCTVTMCANDDFCDFDMFSSRGDCLSFGGGRWDCYHRCLSRSDCYPGWGCFTPTGSTGAIGSVCMPE